MTPNWAALSGGRGDGPDQRQVERAPNRQAFGEDRGARIHRAVGALLVLKQRDFQPRLGERDFLKLIEELRVLSGCFLKDCVGQRKKAAARADLARISSRGESLTRFHF